MNIDKKGQNETRITLILSVLKFFNGNVKKVIKRLIANFELRKTYQTYFLTGTHHVQS